MKAKIFGLAAVAAMVALAPQASATQLLVNGGFENFQITSSYYNIGSEPGTNGGGPDNPVPADFGWTVSNGNVDIVSYQPGAYGPAPTNGGSYGLDLVGYGSTGEISQTFNTTAGVTYDVSFVYKSNPGVIDPTANVLLDGNSIGSVTGGTGWQTFTYSFVGTGGVETFAINETYGYNNGGVFLDNASISPVPELSTWAMMLAGFAALGFAGYRRTKATAFLRT